MLLLFLVVGPTSGDSVDALRDALASTALSEAAAPAELLDLADALAAPHALAASADARFGDPGAVVGAILDAAARSEGSLLAVVSEPVGRAVVDHAFAAPVSGRTALDAGALSEVEVRLDAPWTVNRLNDRCHQPGVPFAGIVRT